MSKSSEEIKELQRLINRLVSIEGTLLLLPGAAFLVSIEAATDPDPLLNALAQGAALTEAEGAAIIQRAFSLRAPPRRLSAAWLATAQRDLKRLESPGLLALAQENPKLFKGLLLDRAWVAKTRQRLDLLRGLDLSALPAGPLQVVSALHGEDAARALSGALEESVQRRSNDTRKAARRVELLALRLEGKPSLREEHEYAGLIEGAAAQVRATLTLPGRARRKKLWRLVLALYRWPDLPKETERPEASLPLSEALPTAIRELSGRVASAQPRLRLAEYRAQLTRVLLGYAVLFPPQKSLRLEQPNLALLQRRYKPAKAALAGLGLSLEQALDLVSLQYQPKETWGDEQERLTRELKMLGAWVAQGLSCAALREVAQRQLLGEMLGQEWSAKTAQSYCKWVLQLAPHYQQQGIKLAITPETFHQLQQAKNEELALLAQCLLTHHAASSPRAARQQIATLDATIALFQKLPQQLRDCLKHLEDAPQDLGQTLHPAFSRWLNDPDRLNRYLHLSALLNDEPGLSHSLLEDFSREQRRDQERQYLLALAAPTALQQKMLARLSEAEAPISPARTQRRLDERINDLLQRLYRARLDALIAESLRRAYGLSIPAVTPAWRDIFRFYMSIQDNRDLLGLLLQKATERPGHFIAPALPANQRWLAQAAAHFNVQAWLAPRRQVVVEERSYTLQLEEDPIEVLRMGVPFDTCLSLEDGSNAASTVLNALDVNKRVLYLRDQKGAIIARQLLAISAQYRLLSYRVYCSLSKEQEPTIRAHFTTFVDQLASEANLLKTNTGAPDKLHEGFWYDDGALSEAAPREANEHLTRYCALLQLSTPTNAPESLQAEADAWAARQDDQPEAALVAMRYWEQSPHKSALVPWLYERLGHAECVRRALAGQDVFVSIVLACASQKGLRALLLASREVIQRAHLSEPLYQRILTLNLAPTELLAVIKEARRLAAVSEKMDDHGLEHGLSYEVPTYLAQLTLQQLFQVCDEAQPLWDWVVAMQEDCFVCMDSAEHRIIEESPRVYLKDPDQKALLDCLQDKRRSLLSRKIALRLAALFPLPQRSPAAYTPLSWFTRGVTDAVGVRRTLKELARDPRLATSPDLLAALLRQGASQEEVEPLPLSSPQPFSALNNLVMQLAWLGPWLQKRYPSPDCQPSEWHPDVWDLYFHRRYSTPWRKALRREVEDNGEGALRAAKHLCELGDVESLQRLQQNKGLGLSKLKKGAAPQGFHWSWDPFLMTAEVRWQLDPARSDLESYLPGWSSQRLVHLDAALVVAALDLLQRTPTTKLLDDVSTRSPVTRAVEVVFHAELPEWLQVYTLEWLLANTAEPLPERFISAFRQRLSDRNNLVKDLSPRLILKLWEYSAMQATLLSAMSRLYRSCDVRRLWDALEDEATRQALDWTMLRRRWLAAVVTGRCGDELHSLQPEARPREVMRALLSCCEPSDWLDFYGELPDALSVSWFLQELQALPAPPYQSIAALVEDPSGVSWDDKRQRFVWLRELCHARLS